MKISLSLPLLAACVGLAHATTFQDINEAFGVPLMNSDNLWDEDAATVAVRLRWPKESETPRDSSYRLYASASEQILGVRPYSLALYGEGDKVASLSLVFINKGDANLRPVVEGQLTQSKLEMARKKMEKDFEERIKADAATIEERLAKAIGKPGDKTTPRSTRAMREQVKRWDWNNHTFLLSAQAGEYVRLQVLPTDVFLDRRERIKGDELRKQFAERVVRRDNGDVVIGTVPMVNQGPKGYCVPATWERVLRYTGIPADMYVLAMAAQTGVGGGTTTSGMMAAVEETITLAGRRIQRTRGPLRMNEIAFNIDRGVPIMWTMFVNEAHDNEITARSARRKSMTSPEDWLKTELADVRKIARDLAANINTRNGHVRMIIGYNPTTKEIAISDSWSEYFAERWMSLEEAEAISQKEWMSIQF